VPFNSGGEATAALMGGHIDAGIMNPNEIVAQVEAGKAREPRGRGAQAHDRRARRADFREKGYPFYWEQMRGVVGPASMAPEAVAWWQDTLKKVAATKKWQEDYIKANLLTPTTWTGEEANKYLDSITGNYERRARRARRPEEVGGTGDATCAALTGSPAPPCCAGRRRSAPAR
jgi:putative tricarboxylic transport membrane protein